MKKLLILIAVLFTVSIVSYGQLENPPTTPSERNWEVRPDIISGGYTDQEGPYIYKLFNVYTCPPLIYDSYPYYINRHEYIFNLGYGDFKKHGAGSLILYDNSGEVQKENDGSYGLEYIASYPGGHGIGGPGETLLYDGDSTSYIYKKEFVQKMEVEFSAETYTAAVEETLSVSVLVYGGSGYYSLSSGTRPAFLTMVSSRTWEGRCYEPMEGSIAIVVKDAVTGQECAASANIIITEKSSDSNNSGNSGTSGTSSDPGGTSSDPGGTASDPGSDSGDGGDDGGGAVDPDSSDDDPATEPDDSSSDDDEAEADDDSEDSTAADPGSDDSTDSPPDNSSADNSDDTTTDPSDSSDTIEVVIIVPDGTDPADTSDGSDTPSNNSDGSDITSDEDTSDAVIISDTTEEDAPTVIVINDSSGSDSDKIVVTDDGVIKVKPDNYDLAVFMSMFGAMTALNGSATTSESAPMAVQEARGGKDHE